MKAAPALPFFVAAIPRGGISRECFMSALMTTYAPLPVSFDRGVGPLLYDTQGREYLDGLSGIAVTNLGHAHPQISEAICEQSRRLLHCSNIYRIDLQEAVGEKLTRRAGMERVFFSNSGAEANEAAFKLARLHAAQRDLPNPQIIVLEGAFHGRTLAALTATGNERIKQGFEPLVPGFLRAPRNDMAAIEALAAEYPTICAVFLEPVQGESGIRPLDTSYLQALQALCRNRGWLLMLDEVQSGNGRTGSYFYFQQIGLQPDVLCTAKALGNGVPIGACLAQGDAARTFAPGNHGSTYGGNPLACAAANVVLDCLEDGSLMARADLLGKALCSSFSQALRHASAVREIRRAGLMIGIELTADCAPLVSRALEAGLLINVTAARTIRLLPPLVMTEDQAVDFGARLAAVVDTWFEQATQNAEIMVS
jgi:acetylornithine aminotransferase